MIGAIRRALAAASIAALGSCAETGGEKRDIVGPVFFACDDGTLLNVRFDNDDHTARITGTGGGIIVLNRTLSGSGYWYADSRYSLRGKGRDATWQAPGRGAIQCRERGTGVAP